MKHSTQELRAALEKSFDEFKPFSDSARWEFENHLAHIKNVENILEKLPEQASIIDVGCYIGVLPLALRFLGYNACGNDKYVFYSHESGNAYGFSSDELQTLKNIWKRHNLIIESVDVEKEKSTKKYDVVLSIATLEHQPYPRLFLENVASFAKRGGYLYIATPCAVKLANRFRVLLGRPPLSNIDEFYKNARNFNGHWREYTALEVARMGELSAFKVISARTEAIEPVRFRIQRPKKWLQSIARFFAKYIPGTGDSVIVIFQTK